MPVIRPKGADPIGERSHHAKPDPVVLDNGDVLVPVGDPIAGWTMRRVVVGDPAHAEWLSLIQHKRSGGGGLVAAGFIFAFLMPLIGFVIGIVLLAKNRTGEGIAIIVLAVLVVALYASTLQ
jgi:hypothetical protein